MEEHVCMGVRMYMHVCRSLCANVHKTVYTSIEHMYRSMVVGVYVHACSGVGMCAHVCRSVCSVSCLFQLPEVHILSDGPRGFEPTGLTFSGLSLYL